MQIILQKVTPPLRGNFFLGGVLRGLLLSFPRIILFIHTNYPFHSHELSLTFARIILFIPTDYPFHTHKLSFLFTFFG